MKQEIYKLIHDYDHVTFAEIVRKIPGAEGERTMYFNSEIGPLILWSGISDTAIDAIEELWKKEKTIEMEPCQPLTYMLDGILLDYPVITVKKSKKERWCPVVFRSTENVKKKAKDNDRKTT